MMDFAGLTASLQDDSNRSSVSFKEMSLAIRVHDGYDCVVWEVHVHTVCFSGGLLMS